MNGREFKEEMIKKLKSGEAFSLVTSCGNEVWAEAELNSDERIASAQVWRGAKTIVIPHNDTFTDEKWAWEVARIAHSFRFAFPEEFDEREEE